MKLFLLTSLLFLLGCQNQKKETVTNVKTITKNKIIVDSTWIKLGKCRFKLKQVKEKFNYKTLCKFNTLDINLKELTPLNKKDYYSCFQNLTIIPDSSSKNSLLKNEIQFYFYSLQPSFESFHNSIHSFTTFILQENLNKVSILGLYHYLGKKEKNLAGSSNPVGEISTQNKDFFVLASYYKNDTIETFIKSEIIDSKPSFYSSFGLLKLTKVEKYKSGKVDSLIKIVEFVPWDQNVWLDFAEYQNGKLITNFENKQYREK